MLVAFERARWRDTIMNGYDSVFLDAVGTSPGDHCSMGETLRTHKDIRFVGYISLPTSLHTTVT